MKTDALSPRAQTQRSTIRMSDGADRSSLSRLWWLGPLTVVAALIANVAVRAVALALFAVSPLFPHFMWDHLVGFTLVSVTAAVVVFALIARSARRPLHRYRQIAAAVLTLSLLPDAALFFGDDPTGSPAAFLALMVMHVVDAAICVGLLTTLSRVGENQPAESWKSEMHERRPGSQSVRHAPAMTDAPVYRQRSARLVLAVCLLWALFLIYPLVELVHLRHEPGRLSLFAIGFALYAAIYAWAVWRGVIAPASPSRWWPFLSLVGLAVAFTYIHGGDGIGAFLPAGIVAALTLSRRDAIAAMIAAEACLTATAIVAHAQLGNTFAIMLDVLAGGLIVLGINWLTATNRELQAARSEVARLAVAEERHRLARDLHDAVKQHVFAASLEVGAAQALIRRDPGGAETHLAEADGVLRQVKAELNALIHEMQPADLAGKGLVAAVRGYGAAWSRRTGIPVAVRAQNDGDLPDAVEQALFRVIQEALANIAQHSAAARVSLDLAWHDETLTVQVADNGSGFAPTAMHHAGFGLRNMRERMEAVGGTITVESAPGAGTRIVCVYPLDSVGKGWNEHA